MTQEPFGREQRRILGQVLAIHDQVLPVHVHLHVVDPTSTQGVDHVQGHADVAHEDLHRRLGVLVLEEELDAVGGADFRRFSDAVDEAMPALRVGRLEGVVVPLDARPDDEVRAQRTCERRACERLLERESAHLVVGRRETASSEAWIEVKPGADAVDVVPGKRGLHLGKVLLVQLLRIVELVAVDHLAETRDRSPHPLNGCLVGVLGLVADRYEARHHRSERPDAKTRLHRCSIVSFRSAAPWHRRAHGPECMTI